MSVIFALPSGAATYQLVATLDTPYVGQVSGFTISFNDANGDTKLDIGEIISFSGVTDINTSYFWNEVVHVPVVYKDPFGTPQQLSNEGEITVGCIPSQGLGSFWTLVNCIGSTPTYPAAPGWNYTRDIWNYDLTEIDAVPLPAALPLFATGLGVMGLLGWRKKRKKAVAMAAA